MDFGFSAEERELFRAAVESGKAYSAHVETGPDRQVEWRRLGEAGLLGASVPTGLGGRGRTALETALTFEGFARGSHHIGDIFGAAAHLFACVMPMVEFGSPEIQGRYLNGLVTGELIAGNAMTEAQAGSDVGALQTFAEPVDGGFLVTGTKSFVTNGPVADVFIVYAATDRRSAHLGNSALVVDAHQTGVRIGRLLDKIGMDGCSACVVEFEKCYVPEHAVLARPGQGSVVFQESMGWERACLFAIYLGLQDRLVDYVVSHTRNRRQFGRRLAEFQSVANRIVDMKLGLESARLLLYRACWEKDHGDDPVLYAALSKLAVSESSVRAAEDALRLLGARGYIRGTLPESALRDALGGLIFSGTSDIQRQLVAIELGL